MKRSLSLFAAMAVVSTGSAFAADSLSNGKVSGDVSVTYESRNVDKDLDDWNRDLSYSVGTVGLNYETAKYNNLSVNVGLRAYTIN